MGLETGNFINDLNTSNPTPNDLKSQGDDHLRLIKTVLKKSFNGFTGAILLTATDSGTASAHVLTPSIPLDSYSPMLCLLYRPNVTNTGAITVNVSGLGAKAVKTMNGETLTAGDIVAGVPVLLMYDGTQFLCFAGGGFLAKTGNQTLTGNLSVTGNQTVGGNQTIAGSETVTGGLDVGTNISAGGTLSVIGDATIGGDVSIQQKLTVTDKVTLNGDSYTQTLPIDTNTNQIANCAFVLAQIAVAAFNSALPSQSGNAGKYVKTDGTNAFWSDVTSAAGSIYIAQNFGGF